MTRTLASDEMRGFNLKTFMHLIRFWLFALCFLVGAHVTCGAPAEGAPESAAPADLVDRATALASEEPTHPEAAPSAAPAPNPQVAETIAPHASAATAATANAVHEEAAAPSSLEEDPATATARTTEQSGAAGATSVLVIPMREAIARPIFYVLRRGLKEAQESGYKAVVIDMDTPGGELGTTLEIMEALNKFTGETLVYVNKEAISAGAIISSVTDEIHFAPASVIGAAAAVSGGGADVPETMKQKINSYLNAKVRSFSSGKGHRAEVIRAMMDADYEFKIGETVIKPKGELLSLTADEAATLYGDPAKPLLSSGTHDTLDAMLDAKYGAGNYRVTRLEVSWS
ncbi:MAG: hypothetical protein EAZ36_02820, partial [Verrucomicrobia bacterium]